MTLVLLCQFTAQHVSDVNTSIFRSLRLFGALLCSLYCADFEACWYYVEGLAVGDVVSLCRLKQCFSLRKDTTPPEPNHTVKPTHIEPEQYNP